LKKKYSIIIPALNEAGSINDLLDHLKSLDRCEESEIILVDGSPDGDTMKMVADPDIRCIEAPRGRAKQMNAGAALAMADILIFLHADTRLPPEAFPLIEEAMRPGMIVGGAFDLRIDSDRLPYRIISRVASLRSRLTRMPYGDQAIFMRRDYFNAVGHYPVIPLMEDVALMRRIRKDGRKIGFIPIPVVTSCRRWQKEGILYTTLRNWILVSAYLLGASPDKLLKYYAGGKEIYAGPDQ